MVSEATAKLNTPPEKLTAMRAANGQFLPGNKLGKQFQLGQSGNPKGRPPNPLSITARQKEKYLEICPFDAQARSWLEALAESGMRQALTKPEAMGNLQDRHEGKVTQPISGADGQPLIPTFRLFLPEGIKVTLKELNGNGN